MPEMCQELFLDESQQILLLWCLWIIISLLEGKPTSQLSQTDSNEYFCSQHLEKGILNLSQMPLMGAFPAQRRKNERKRKIRKYPCTLLFFLLLFII
jgi:hypothetical protein